MINKDIKHFFSKVREDARNAHKEKTLRYLETYSKNYLANFNDPSIKPSLKKAAFREYKRTLKVINDKKKQL